MNRQGISKWSKPCSNGRCFTSRDGAQISTPVGAPIAVAAASDADLAPVRPRREGQYDRVVGRERRWLESERAGGRRGMRRVNEVQSGRDVAVTVPSCASAIWRTMNNPRPRPVLASIYLAHPTSGGPAIVMVETAEHG